jgi:hypothetical protein
MSTRIWNDRPPDSGEQFVWFQGIGYLRVRDLVRIATLTYLCIATLVIFLTEDLLSVVFLVLFAIVVITLATDDRYSSRRRVNVYSDGGLYVAEYVGSGIFRHGETPAAALTALDDSITDDHGNLNPIE